MKKIAIIVTNEMNEYEIFVPTYIWRKLGITVDLISIEKKNSIILETGSKISCYSTFDKINLSQYHAIYVPGGPGIERLKFENWPTKDKEQINKFVHHITKFLTEKEKLILTTCESSQFLENMGLLQDHQIAGREKDFSIKKKATDELLKSNNVISVRGFSTMSDFAFVVAEFLEETQSIDSLKEEMIL